MSTSSTSVSNGSRPSTGSSRRAILELVRRAGPRAQQVLRRDRARRGRLAGDVRRAALAAGPPSAPMRATSPSPRRTTLADPREARGGGGQAATARGRRRSRRGVEPMPSAEAGALALGPGLGRAPEKKELVRRLLEETDVPRSSTPTAVRAGAVRARGADRAHSPRGRARAADRRGVVLGRRTSARGAAACRRALRLRLLLKGADTLIGAPGEGVLVHDAWDSRPGDRGHGRRPDRDHGGVPGQGNGATDGRGGCRGGAPRRRARSRVGLVAGDVVGALPWCSMPF